jgi:NO-binding membrane sensor protein with MHYT domain
MTVAALRLRLPSGKAITIDYSMPWTIVSMLSVVILSIAGFKVASLDAYWSEVLKEKRLEMLSRDIHAQLKYHPAADQFEVLRAVVLFRRSAYIIAGGIMMALGICVMHFIEMHGQVMDAIQTFNWGRIAISFMVATVASCAGLIILFRVLTFVPRTSNQILAAFLIATAVTATHVRLINAIVGIRS